MAFGAQINYYTNLVNMHKKLIYGFTHSINATTTRFYEWSNDSKGPRSDIEGVPGYDTYWISKDFDFGSPSIRKKIYKVYVTYRCTGHSGIKMKYATNGGGSFYGVLSSGFQDFSSSKSTNYNVESFSTAGTATGFQDSDGDWAVAEIKPSSSISNVYSIQLSFDRIIADTGNATDHSATTSLALKAGSSSTDSIYNNYNIMISAGTGRYNVKKITAYDATGGAAEKLVTWSGALTDYGYGNTGDDDSDYVLGNPPDDFEINDITIIYRTKPIK